MSGILELSILSVAEIAFSIVLFEKNRKKHYSDKLGQIKWQIIVGVIFGVFAIFGTELGTYYEGFVVNIRDAAPLIAGLYFGPLAGIIAGLLGGIERWLAVYWGAGEFTRLACSLGTIFAGFFAAFIKKFILDKKTPGWIYAFMIATVTEVVHMLLVFFTNMNALSDALLAVSTVAPVMVPLVSITTTGIAVFQYFKTYKYRENVKHTITDDIQRVLMFSVIAAYLIANIYVVYTQKNFAMTTAENTIGQSLADIKADADESGLTGDELDDYIIYQVSNWHIGSTGFFAVMKSNNDNKVYTSNESVLKSKDFDDSMVYKMNLDECEQGQIYYMDKKYSKNKEFDCYFAYIVINGCYVVAIYPGTEANLGRDYSILITAFMEILILAILFLTIYFLIRKVVVENIQRINESLARITGGNLDTIIDVRSNAEFTSLSDDINTTVGTLKKYISDAENRINTELQFAKEIQSSALPTVFPRSPFVDLFADMIPAKVVGGDFYDFYRFSNNKAALLVADVSGKGIPAALCMMNAKALIKGLVETGSTPAEAMQRANEELCASNATGMFVTAWLGILDLSTGILTFSNAGHNPPIIARSNGDVRYLNNRHGLVLAAMEGVTYKEESIILKKGDGLILYTDGVTEATDINNELYGEQRFLEIVDKTNAVNMRYLCKEIKRDVDEFVGDAPQFDDMTIMALKIKDDYDNTGFIELEPEFESMEKLTDFIDSFCKSNGISSKMSKKMLIVADEIYSNILRYSQASSSAVSIQERKGMVSISFEDDGIAYNPLEKEDPDVSLSAEEREIGGLGIYMVKNMAEDVKYTRINANNVLDIILE